MITEHDPHTSPLFLYVPFQAPHWPVQNPPGTEERHLEIPNKQRRKWCGLVSHIDDNIGRIVAALEANQGMLGNTVIFALSDNGGDMRTGASNYPYRGDKMTVFEGGTKTPAFVYSPNDRIIPESRRGTSSDALGHGLSLSIFIYIHDILCRVLWVYNHGVFCHVFFCMACFYVLFLLLSSHGPVSNVLGPRR